MALAHDLQQLPSYSSDLGADAVTGEKNNAVLSHDGHATGQPLRLLRRVALELPEGFRHLRQLAECR